tara:strand:- start:34267 stop:35283 length:1017 start_codon:yes stop_codon:yes gene_type:complete
MDEQFRVGIVGCGNHMYEFLLGTLKWTPQAQVVAACDTDSAKLARLTRIYNVPGRYTDLAAMLATEKLDAVIMAVGHLSNAPLIRAALEAGVHVFVEKTPCNSAAEIEELIAIQKASGKSVMVGFNRRYMTGYALAREVSQRPEFGPVRMYHSQFHTTPYRNETIFKVNHVIHHLDLARFLMGEITLTHVDRVAVDDRRVGYNINFVSPQGGIGVIQSASMLDEIYPMERLELVGNGRNVVVDNIKTFTYNRPPVMRKDAYRPVSMDDAGDALSWNPSHGFYPRFSHHGYEVELRHFFDCLAAGKPPQPGLDDSLLTMRLLDSMEGLLAGSQGQASAA